MPITPEQFKAEWFAVSEKYHLSEAVVANWAWDDNEGRRNEGRLPPCGQVTNDDITRMAERALFDVAEALRLGVTWECPPSEGRRIALDAVLFGESKDGSRSPEVAYEHENCREKCADEVARLMTYRAPLLSVLVTYLRPLKTPDRVDKWLPKYKTWFERAAVSGGEFLVIFATVMGDWEFYRYQPTGFQKLLD
ncbi:MAG: hypothetical protein NTX53_11835 [candidate division WOR-3 bacterium]|nr:hypothetical protein [candidate division WOR-3 bacterium]